MNILIAGGTGFVGRYLVPVLLTAGHEVLVLGRSSDKIRQCFPQSVIPVNWATLDTIDPGRVDVIINLVGHNIGASRWTDKIKQQILKSRVMATTMLSKWCATSHPQPRLLNASAIGIYGLQSLDTQLSQPLDESATIAPQDFLSEVGVAWEQATQPAVEAGVAVTMMRFGVVLKRGEGMLKKLTPSFAVGLGGRVGSGQQILSWIAIEDLVAAILFLIKHPKLTGPINLVSPGALPQQAFAKALAKSMHRPCLIPLPAFIVKTLFGQMGNELLLHGQYVVPQRLEQAGFQFQYPDINAALAKDWL